MTTANATAAGMDCGREETSPRLLRSSADGSLLKALEHEPEKWIPVLRKIMLEQRAKAG
jgi:hypothetical protein